QPEEGDEECRPVPAGAALAGGVEAPELFQVVLGVAADHRTVEVFRLVHSDSLSARGKPPSVQQASGGKPADRCCGPWAPCGQAAAWAAAYASRSFVAHASQHTSTVSPPIATVIASPSSGQSQ